MLTRSRRIAAFAFGCGMILLLAPAAQAQLYPQRTNQPQIITLQRFPTKTGEYLGMSGGYMACMLDGAKVMVQFDKNSKLKVTGMATPDALATGMYVQFKGTFDRHGKTTEPIKDVVIYTPDARNQPGAFEAGNGGALEERAAGKKKGPVPATTMYQISGKITAVHRNTVSVDCGNLKVKAEIAPDAAVKLESSDPALASAGDKISISGIILPAPGRALCSDAVIELATPLTGKKKSHVAKVADKVADKTTKTTDKTTDKPDKAVDKTTDKPAKGDAAADKAPPGKAAPDKTPPDKTAPEKAAP
jgi:hypothetical protein